ncbi:MAG: fibro-slime domain-containing protein [Labilithrix sp.]
MSGRLHTLAPGSPQQCVSYADAGADAGPSATTTDAAVNLDQCNPYCYLTNDTPTGYDAGISFTLDDAGGLTATICGDGQLVVGEECDDGNQVSGDGCSKGCIVELGYECAVPGNACAKVDTCGNGTKESAEECDDGNTLPYDGCSPTCQRDLVCPIGGCNALCGDGFLFPSEACDDGNLRDGDGCDHDCKVEPDTTCTPVTAPPPDELILPIILRDFKGFPEAGGHPDFENWCCGDDKGIVAPTLAADGRPVLATGHTGSVTSAASFYQWYHSDASVNKTIVDSITLTKQPDGSYKYSSNDFYPLDGNLNGFGNYTGWGHDYHFTSELRYPFTFKGTGLESFTFTGDDDVFVFVNNQLLVDLGGVHGAESATVTLDATLAATLGLVVGTTYEIVVFQAERHTSGSNYTLTLRGFDKTVSQCIGPVKTTVVRTFTADCPSGTRVSWDAFLWRAKITSGGGPSDAGGDAGDGGGGPDPTIDFRAATADDVAGLPNNPIAAPATVPIGQATKANSPTGTTWAQELDGGGKPVPVSYHLNLEGNTKSKALLRVFMTFNVQGTNSPTLYEWQQQFSCVPAE